MQLAQTVTVFRLSEEVLTADSLRIVHHCLEEPHAPVVHLDLGDIQLPTAGGLGALVALNKTLRARGGALVLLNVTASAYEVLVLTHLVEVLAISPSWRIGAADQVERLFA
jgi:anti-anti-sigma regulatory factor